MPVKEKSVKSLSERMSWVIVLTIIKQNEYSNFKNYLESLHGGGWGFAQKLVDRLKDLETNELKIIIEAVKYMNDSKVAKFEIYKRFKDCGIIN